MQVHFAGKEKSKRSSGKIKNRAQRSQLEGLLGCRQRYRPVPPLPTAGAGGVETTGARLSVKIKRLWRQSLKKQATQSLHRHRKKFLCRIGADPGILSLLSVFGQARNGLGCRLVAWSQSVDAGNVPHKELAFVEWSDGHTIRVL